MTERRDYADGTYLTVRMPWSMFTGGAAQCADGTVRRLKRIATTADTFFSIPASVVAHGRTVSGYVTVETSAGSSVETEEDPSVVRFYAYRYGKNHDAIVPRCAVCALEIDHTSYGWATVESLRSAAHPTGAEFNGADGHRHYPFATTTTTTTTEG